MILHRPEDTEITARAIRDQGIYDFIKRGSAAQQAIDAANPQAVIDATVKADTRERMRKLAKQPHRPPMTPKLAEQLAKLADQVRSRANSRSGLYGLPKSIAPDVRRAIQWIDDNADFYRRHR